LHKACQDCEDTACVKACNQKAIFREKDGTIVIDPLKCIEQKTCISTCPYGIIHITDNSNLAYKRNWCDQEIDSGWKEPRCVDACPTVAFLLGEEEDLQDLVNKADRLYPGAITITFYIGDLKAKRLSGDTVFNPRKNIPLKESNLTRKIGFR
jgi:Fe-S-cluster-containing dehydrogenase component